MKIKFKNYKKSNTYYRDERDERKAERESERRNARAAKNSLKYLSFYCDEK